MALKYGGMDASLKARLKELEATNQRFKKMFVEERLKAESGKAISVSRYGLKCD